MKNPADLLKTAADLLDAQEAKIASLTAEVDTLTQKLARPVAKVASVDLVAQAKIAADILLEKRLLSSPAMRDAFAAKIAGDHPTALVEMARLAGVTKAANELPRLGEGDTNVAPAQVTTDSWVEAHARFTAAR